MPLRALRAAIPAVSAALVAAGLWAAWGGEPGGGRGPATSTASSARDVVPTDATLAVDPPSAPVPIQQPRALLGAGSCTSAGCHASAVEGHAAWQSSFTVWSTRDRHARAHRVLYEPLAARIVAALAARDPGMPPVPAHRNTACIGCHATARGPLASEGVSCESCHGPAGDWLVSHTLAGWKTHGNSLGMVDLADPFTAARQCAGCHVGGQPASDGAVREVSHDLIAAGHPRLAFELRSYKRAEPPHWHDRFMDAAGDGAAETSPKPRLDPLDEWGLGRLGAVRAFLEQVSTQAAAAPRGERRGGEVAGVWPEFTAFDCYGCHRPATAPQDRGGIAPAAGLPLGIPRLEPLHWTLLDLAVSPEAATTLGRFRGDVERRWWQPPDAAAIEECLAVIDAARHHFHPPFADMPTAAVADRIVAGVDATRWDEAAAGLAALEAAVDRAALRNTDAGTLATAREQIAALRRLLEFPQAEQDGRAERYDSPRDYDAARVAAALAAVAAALQTAR